MVSGRNLFPKVRILDTPGLADTRGTQQDELHRRSILTQIQKHIDSITAVLILANGTVPRVTVGTDYALSTLTATFPKSLTGNIGFIFTNVLSPLHWNFSRDTLPNILRDAPQFLLNNPVSLQRKYLKFKDNPNMKRGRMSLRDAVKAGEQNALRMLVELFDWLDGLEPQRTTGIIETSQRVKAHVTNPVTSMDQAEAKNAVSGSPTRTYRLKLTLLILVGNGAYLLAQVPIGTEGKEVKIGRNFEKGWMRIEYLPGSIPSPLWWFGIPFMFTLLVLFQVHVCYPTGSMFTLVGSETMTKFVC